MPAPVSTRDLFAELYVAGLLADAGWHLYFPKRDHGFDFIATKTVGGALLVRPVQVKGLYPTAAKTDKAAYGYRGRLTQLHPEMVLALPFFPITHEPAPLFTAFLPRAQVKQNQNKPSEYVALPAAFKNGKPVMRPHYKRFFDALGMDLMKSDSYSSEQPELSGPCVVKRGRPIDSE